jgi:tetratricopeptide (TPR) repeat protein
MLHKRNRTLIPRWRDSRVGTRLAESQPTEAPTLEGYHPPFSQELNLDGIRLLVEEWLTNKSVGGAADILNYGYIPEVCSILKEPAEYLLEREAVIPEPLVNLAKRVLGVDLDQNVEFNRFCLPIEQFYKQARRLKSQLFVNPRDAIALVDLARIYASLGQNHKARKAISTATSIWPNHRFILRTASRFFVHNQEPDYAFYLLSRSARTVQDPWLLSALLSVATILEKPERYVKKAKLVLQSGGFDPRHISELAGALATVQINEGKNREVKRNLNKALIAPNDNTVAQAMWVSQDFGLPIYTRDEWFIDPFSSEARYYQCEMAGEFEEARRAPK